MSTPPSTPQQSTSTPPSSPQPPASPASTQQAPSTFKCPLDKRPEKPCAWQLQEPSKNLGKLLAHLRSHGAKLCKLPRNMEASLGIAKYYHAPCELYWVKGKHQCIPSLNPTPSNEDSRHSNTPARALDSKSPAPTIPPAQNPKALRFTRGAALGIAPSIDLSIPIRFTVSSISVHAFMDACSDAVSQLNTNPDPASLSACVEAFLELPSKLLPRKRQGMKTSPPTTPPDPSLDPQTIATCRRAMNYIRDNRLSKAAECLFQEPQPPVTEAVVNELKRLHPPASAS